MLNKQGYEYELVDEQGNEIEIFRTLKRAKQRARELKNQDDYDKTPKEIAKWTESKCLGFYDLEDREWDMIRSE